MAHDWVEVEDVPYDGPVPIALPSRRTIATRSGAKQVALMAETRRWWETVASMPHCVIWARSDWTFALATALVADMAFRGVIGASTELRHRERIIGMTADARRDLRIRYVPAIDGEPVSERDAAIADLGKYVEARRHRLTDER